MPGDRVDRTGPLTLDPDIAALLKRDEHGLVAAVVQQHDTGEVLMVGWMDDEALRRTLTDGRVTFWSRSRQEYWRKGDTSGHVQWVQGVRLDCDGDALLVRSTRSARPATPATAPASTPASCRRWRAGLVWSVRGLSPAPGARDGGRVQARPTAPTTDPTTSERQGSVDRPARRPHVGADLAEPEVFTELALEHRRVIPVVRRLLADAETPVGVYRKLAKDAPGTFLLESAEHGGVWSRYSIVGARSAATLTERDGEAHWIGDASGRRARPRRPDRGPARHRRRARHRRASPACRR